MFRKPNEAERNVNASLYFGNLDPQVTEVLMYELFIQFGPVRSLNMPKDRVLKTHQGFGFVEFKNIADADYVVNILRGIRLYGKLLRLKKSLSSKNDPEGATGGENGSNLIDVGAKLFINNLNPLIDEAFLQQTFSKFGTLIKPPSIVRDPETGESKCHGFLTFDDFSASDHVIETMDGATLMNTKVSISYAYKEDPANMSQKRVRHGDEIERLLAESGKSNKVIVPKKPSKVTKPKKRKNKR